MRVPSNPLVLIGPTILFVFTLSFLLVWWRERKQQYLLFFAISCFLFCLATSSQLFAVPPGHGPNAIVSAFLYTSSVLVLSDGLLRRSKKQLPLLGYFAGLMSVVFAIAYFYYIDRQLLVRIYILNFGLGLILIGTAWKLAHLRSGRASERFLFWILLAFAVHFFPRTIFTVGWNAPSAQSFGFSPFWLALQFSLAILGVALALALLAVTIDDTIEVLRRERATDPLTGLLNRRGFEERVIPLLQSRHMRPVSLIVADIDHFKNINDAFGHQVGDNVLAGFSRILIEMLSKAGVCGRLGGEEFVVFLPNCYGSAACAIAERLRHQTRDNAFVGLPEPHRVTVSLGVAEIRPRETVAELISRADSALYAAKRAGRDCVSFD
jgi:diguanylate cyclase (GGDEF)-like protein